jgi:hypothetical protein
MNKRIEKLIEEANLNVIQTKGMDNIVDGCYIVSPDKIKKFAELIVKECSHLVFSRDYRNEPAAHIYILKAFDVK